MIREIAFWLSWALIVVAVLTAQVQPRWASVAMGLWMVAVVLQLALSARLVTNETDDTPDYPLGTA
jgi:hypothetical protein